MVCIARQDYISETQKEPGCKQNRMKTFMQQIVLWSVNHLSDTKETVTSPLGLVGVQ